MIKKSFNYMKNNPFTILWGVLATAAFLFFTAFLSFFILQADDFYYASFFKNGFFEFIRLTVDHFKTFQKLILSCDLIIEPMEIFLFAKSILLKVRMGVKIKTIIHQTRPKETILAQLVSEKPRIGRLLLANSIKYAPANSAVKSATRKNTPSRKNIEKDPIRFKKKNKPPEVPIDSK